ncbi:hypothetical protein GCM10010228_47720 [Streptomyces massasporeus]|nr:hypothetical protein GCM10010228_47720 [Streptomyces massasporeus]
METAHGRIWCYGYGPDRSTCVVAYAPETWAGLGLDRASEADGRALLEKLFADVLDGHPVPLGRPSGTPWQTFRTLTNDTWHHGTVVLLGDAAHTTHYSIGAGTTLALADAMALAAALRQHPELPQPLARYERERKAALLPVQSAARYSAQWYENLPRYMHLPPERMFALLGQRHSPLLPYVPPQLYYRLDRAAGRLEPLLRFKRRLGPKGRANRARTVAGRAGVARRTLGELLFTGRCGSSSRPCTSNDERTAALTDFLHTCNHHRCHTALGGHPPISRVNNALGQYT